MATCTGSLSVQLISSPSMCVCTVYEYHILMVDKILLYISAYQIGSLVSLNATFIVIMTQVSV